MKIKIKSKKVKADQQQQDCGTTVIIEKDLKTIDDIYNKRYKNYVRRQALGPNADKN